MPRLYIVFQKDDKVVKYKLLKELPKVPIGSLFSYNEETDMYEFVIEDDYEYIYNIEQMQQLKKDGWSEVVKDEKVI